MPQMKGEEKKEICGSDSISIWKEARKQSLGFKTD
jgi:hypothetical protein